MLSSPYWSVPIPLNRRYKPLIDGGRGERRRGVVIYNSLKNYKWSSNPHFTGLIFEPVSLCEPKLRVEWVNHRYWNLFNKLTNILQISLNLYYKYISCIGPQTLNFLRVPYIEKVEVEVLNIIGRNFHVVDGDLTLRCRHVVDVSLC